MKINTVFSKKLFFKLLTLLTLIIQTSGAIAAPQDLSFTTPVYYQVGSSPFNVKTGDFNGDEKLDLVIANRDSNNISILLGKGDGTFFSQTSYATGSQPLCTAIGDFNGDHRLDLAIANSAGNNISVFTGKGDGTFNSPQSYPAGARPSSILTVDFNGDHKLDLALSNLDSNSVSIYLGKGDGTFNPQVVYSSGIQPTSILTADFNLDGKLDLAVGNYNQGQSNIATLLGKGDGTFNAPSYCPVGSNPRLSTADFNGDQFPDLAVANVLDHNVTILIGRGNGNFNLQATYPVGSQPIYIAGGDFDVDGIPDLVITNRVSGYISVLSGKGDGTFYPQVIYAAGSHPFSAAVGDFNGDGKDDLAVADFNNSRVAVLINNNSVPVNLPPVLVPIGAQTVDQGKTLELVIRASDPNNDPLTFEAANLPAGAAFDPATQLFSWTPGYNQSGDYSVRFKVSDGSLSAVQDLLITVNKLNLPPVITIHGSQNVNEGQLLEFTVNAADPNEDALTLAAFNLPAGAAFKNETLTFSWIPDFNQAGLYTVNFQADDGSLTVSQDVLITVNQVNLPPEMASIGNQTVEEGQSLQFTVSAFDPDGDNLTYTATGMPAGAGFDPATQTFSWTPDYNQAGLYTVNFQVSDGSLIVSRSVFINVTQVNLPPEIVSIGDQTVEEGQTLRFTVSAIDPDGDLLTYTVTGMPEGAVFDPVSHTFSWTPGYTQAGSYTVSVQVSDGSLTVSQGVLINVTQMNRPPVLAAISNQTIAEGQPLQFTISAIDPDGDPLTYTVNGAPEGASFDPASLTFSWTPNYRQAGIYTVNFQVSDGSLAVSREVTLTVTQVNLQPEFTAIGDQTVDEGKLLQFTVSATDPDGDSLSYSATGVPEGANFNPATQKFNWTPSYLQAGIYTVTFQVSDGNLAVNREVLIKVNQVNLPPVLGAIANQTVNVGQLLQFAVNATDPDGDALTYTATGLPEGAGFDPATQTFSWTPGYNQAGNYSVTFQVNDGSLSVNRKVSITVNPVNQPPVLAKIGNQTIEAGQLLQFTVKASDPDGDKLTYAATGVPPGAKFNAATQTFTWTPQPKQTGGYEVVFQVTDGFFKTQEVVVITVIEKPDRETRIKTLIQRLIRLIEESKLSKPVKAKLIMELKIMAHSRFTIWEINGFKAILYGMKWQVWKGFDEIRDLIDDIIDEFNRLYDHWYHWPDWDDCDGRDHRPDKDDYHDHDRDRKPDKDKDCDRDRDYGRDEKNHR